MRSVQFKLIRRMVSPIAIAIALVPAVVSPASAQVTFFKKPPTAGELREALLGGSPSKPDANGLTRGIVWKSEGKIPANVPQASQAAVSAAAPVSAPVTPGAAGPAAGMPINFARGSARIEDDSLGFIESVAQVLRSDTNVNLVIEGHTDATGSYRRNMVLSWERAMGVYRVLVEHYGIEPTRLQLIGKGPSEPLPGTTPRDDQNRRVQFRVSG
ncbi:MAG: OmpA family protein [Burkholderiaceae bacterium]